MITKWISNLISIAVAIASVIISVLVITQDFTLEELAQIILWLLTGIVISELLSRLVHAHRLEEKLIVGFERTINAVERTASTRFNARYLIGKHEIMEHQHRLNQELQTGLRAVLYGGANSPVELADQIANAFRKKKQVEGKELIFTAIIVIDFDKLPAGFVETIEKKMKIYEKQGVRDQIRVRFLDQKPPLGMNVIIVDNYHVLFALRNFIDTEKFFAALLVEGRTEIAGNFAQWIDEDVFPKTITYEQFVAQFATKQSDANHVSQK